jgi:hypothetical protein
MKFRIIKHGDIYIPQQKWCFLWWNFEEGYADIRVERYSLKEAEAYIEHIIEIRKKYASKELVKEYNL